MANIAARNAAFVGARAGEPRNDAATAPRVRPAREFSLFTRGAVADAASGRAIFVLWIAGDKWINAEGRWS